MFLTILPTGIPTAAYGIGKIIQHKWIIITCVTNIVALPAVGATNVPFFQANFSQWTSNCS